MHELEIDCINWGYSTRGNIYEFYSDKEGKIVTQAFSVHNWDIINIKHESSAGDS